MSTTTVTAPRVPDGPPPSQTDDDTQVVQTGKAGRVGFDWGGWEGSLDKVIEETGEIREVAAAGAGGDAAHHEIGDLRFAGVNLARKLDVDAESALHDASLRFTRRFEFIEDRLAEGGRQPADSNLEEMDALWNAAKAAGIGTR